MVMVTMMNVWAATCSFVAQSIKFKCLSFKGLDVSRLSFIVDKFYTFLHGLLVQDATELVFTCTSLSSKHGNGVIYRSDSFIQQCSFSPLIILQPFRVLMLLFNLILTGIMSTLRHLSENLLWFWKSTILHSNLSHCQNNLTFSIPYSDLICRWMFLILFLWCNNKFSQ